jgi:hypothetical protein
VVAADVKRLNCHDFYKTTRLMKIKYTFLFLVTTLALALAQTLWAADGKSFSSPQDAVNALVAAAENHDTNTMHAIFGPEGPQLVSRDAVEAAQAYKMFLERITQMTALVTNSDSSVSLQIGNDGWPFPIPLTKQNGQWFFDTAAGRQEILNRRIGMDEMGAIDVCHTYVEAQREYASQDRMTNGVLAYAQFLRSDPGTHNGLFWPAKGGEPLSPFGPLIAAAHGEGYHHAATMMSEQQAPYHGYYFKILTRQGRHAAGGKYNYIINGNMIGGFALVAWPAEWANTGVMTFIVNQQGIVYQCNLGEKTTKVASSMKAFDPDSRWTVVP